VPVVEVLLPVVTSGAAGLAVARGRLQLRLEQMLFASSRRDPTATTLAASDADEPEELSVKTTLRMKRTYEAPAQRVFDAWTSPEVMRRWWHAERDWETSEAEVDLRVGGAIRVVMRDPGEGVEHGGGGHYTVVDPPHRLAFTWTWDDVPHETLIEIEFEESDGSTEVRFTHSSLLDEEMVRSHEGGWGRCFDNLERTLAAGD
jgi:uncharacterized protein YndB with AHSA1/START domain